MRKVEKKTPAARRAIGAPAIRASVRTAAIMAGIGGLGLAGSGVVYALHTSEAASIAGRIAQKEQEAVTGEETAARLETVRNESLAIESKLRYLEESVTPSLYIPSLLRQVDQMARGMKLEVSALHHTLELTPTQPPADATDEQKEKFRPLPYDLDRIDMEIRGDYWTIARFVHRLTKFPKILSVETVSQQPAPGTDGKPGVLVARLTMTGFVFKADATKGSAEGAAGGSGDSLKAEEKRVIDQASGKAGR
ncbi:MAG: type 4a pilus biogenesis protein PilO [Armatimonadota bacterium]